MKPEMQKCNGRMCLQKYHCRRFDAMSDIRNPDPATCQWYYPAYYVKDKPMSMRQEPLQDRTIAGKKWSMYMEFMGKNVICHAFIEDPKIQHSYGCTGTKDEAIAGCVAQIDRIYTKKAK